MKEKYIEKYNIYRKVFILIYIIFSYINKVNQYYLVMFSLVYLILNISYFLFYKKIILIISSIISLVIGLKYMPLVMILYSFNIIELIINKSILNIKLFIFILLPIPYIKSNIKEYIIFTAISYIFINLYQNFINERNKLNYEIEEKRKEIHTLNKTIEKSKKFTKQSIYTLKLEERNKLSKDIHDKVGHTIAGSLMQLEAVKIVVDKDVNKAKYMIDNTINVLRLGMDDIRKILREINPPNEQIGINKIKLLLEEKTKNTSFSFNLVHSGDIKKISKKQWIFIYQAITETSTNSMKYSQGNNISIKIEVLNKLIKIQIKDNGIGLEKITKGIGLNSIEQNVLDLGGKFIIDGKYGFSVVFLLPIENE